VIAVVSSHVWWWLARASGLVAWTAAAATVIWGLALSSNALRRRGTPAWILDMHRYLGTLTIVFVGVHLGALLLDRYVQFTLGDLLVPMTSPWRPGALAWGIAALYLLLLVQATSWLMRWIPRRLWHSLHLLSFVVLTAGTVHGAQAGADSGRLAVQLGALVVVCVVALLVLLRLLKVGNTTADTRNRRTVRVMTITPPTATLDPELTERLARLSARAATRVPPRITRASRD
jgi:hypothetical protein